MAEEEDFLKQGGMGKEMQPLDPKEQLEMKIDSGSNLKQMNLEDSDENDSDSEHEMHKQDTLQ